MDPYQRYIPVQAGTKVKPEYVALIGGSIALVVIVLYAKSRKKKGKRK